MNPLKENFEDSNWVFRIRKSKQDIQYNGQNKKDKKTNNDLLKPGVNPSTTEG